MRSRKIGLYIHIPFCRSKCAYCDFLSFAGANEETMAAYTQALLAEMRTAQANELHNRTIDTVYIGGGTPTSLPASFLCDIINGAKQFALTPDAEITVEMNPGGKENHALLPALKSAGVNRLSIGLQAWQDALLARIHRTHTAHGFEKTFRAARETGFDNINVDLIFSLPGQTMEMWREGLAQIAALKPEHISAYSLTPAEGTLLWEWLESGKMVFHDDTDRAMYREAIHILNEAGYNRYEISNFALPGRESRHNMNTWKRRPYRGFGLGAHSFMDSGNGGCRWNNTEDMDAYIRGENAPELTTLTQADAMAETMILGLRLTEGICENAFQEIFGTTPLAQYGNEMAKHIANGLLAREGGRIFLTPRGADLANQVLITFI